MSRKNIFRVGVFSIILFFICSWRLEAKNITKEYKRFKRFFSHGESIDLNHELDLSNYVGGKLIEVTIRYNMLRSRLGIDWLVNDKVVFHTSLERGLLKSSSYRFERPINLSDRFKLRLTGNQGQIQLIEMDAQVEDVNISEKDEKEKAEEDLNNQVKPEAQKSGWLLLAQDWAVLTPDEINNTAGLEIDGVMLSEGVVIAGPGLVIERVPGFDTHGRPDETPGVSMELPFIFEYKGPAEKNLEETRKQFQKGEAGGIRPISVIVRNLGGEEEFRWNLFDFGLDKIEKGQEGRKQYVYKHIRKPNNSVGIERNPDAFKDDKSFNPATDKLVEIEGVLIAYAPIEINEKDRTISIVLDYIEGGQMWHWVREIAEGKGQRRPVMIADWNPEEGESNRTVYFNCFPLLYRQFTGFGQSEKIKEKVVIGYGWKERN